MVLVSLFVVASIGSAWLSVGASDGNPPVTIIEIPIPLTTEPEATTSTTKPDADQPGPTTTLVEQLPADTNEQGKTDVDPVLLVEGRNWPWQAVAGVSLILGGLAILSLRFVRRAFSGPSFGTPTPESILSDNVKPVESTASASGHFEALEYCTDGDRDESEVYVRTLGEFSSPEEAIEAARSARSEYHPDPYPDAWWVVWNTDIKHAWWYAELGTEGESVIDLRSGRRSPYSGKDALLVLSIPPDT